MYNSVYDDKLADQLASLNIEPHIKEDAIHAFVKIDTDQTGHIPTARLVDLFREANFSIARYQLNEFLEKHKKRTDGGLTPEEFAQMLQDEENERTSKFQASVDIRGEISVKESTFGGHHQVAHGEVRAFTHFINNELKDDVDLKKHLPMNLENDELYDSVQDGVILCKLVNKCKPGTISEKAINKTKLDVIFRQRENVQLAIISAASIGCHVISITPITISQRKEHIILGLIWQLLKKIAFSQVNLKEHPDLAGLLRPGETIEDLMNLSPEELLKRWVNYHLDNDEKYSGKGIDNFGNDLKDSQAYISLLNQIQPGDLSPKFNHNAQGIPNDKERAQAVHDMAKRLGCGK